MLERSELSDLLGPPHRGKVRDVYEVDAERLLVVTTDRLSAFDQVIGVVPHKGQILNELSAFWFPRLAPVLASHLVAVLDPNAMVVRRCTPLPVEVVVRGYLTGSTSTSLWTRYAAGERDVYGVRLPDGLAKGDPLPTPLLTPTTKASAGHHDEPLAPAEVVARGLVREGRWLEASEAALGLFARGSAIAAAAGVTLVDTKYELGVDPAGRLRLIDEVHTPDSSRFWRRGTTAHLDKEVVRIFYADRLGYRGEGPPPPMPEALVAEVTARYRECYERLTGRAFVPAPGPIAERLASNVERYLDERS